MAKTKIPSPRVKGQVTIWRAASGPHHFAKAWRCGTTANAARGTTDRQAARPEPPELALPTELPDLAWTGLLCTSIWQADYRYALDNFADPTHG